MLHIIKDISIKMYSTKFSRYLQSTRQTLQKNILYFVTRYLARRLFSSTWNIRLNDKNDWKAFTHSFNLLFHLF